MKNFIAEPPSSRTAKLSDASRTILTSFKCFNLYDTNIFATFFFSDIEKIWLVIVKNGLVTLNGAVVKTYGILHNFSLIDFDTTRIEFVNAKDEIGLSQVLVERFLTSNNCKITSSQILELSDANIEKDVIFGSLKRNSLFYQDGEGWGLNYKNYIDFLEQRNDPFVDSVLLEFENTLTTTGPYQTFNINTIWNNTYFSDERLSIGDGVLLSGRFGRYKGIPNWPHSSRAAGLKDADQCAVRLQSTDREPGDVPATGETEGGRADHKGPGGSPGEGHAGGEQGPADGSLLPDENKDTPDAARGSGGSGASNMTHLNTLLDQFTIKNPRFSSLRRCYSSADGTRYSDGYRLWDCSEGPPERVSYFGGLGKGDIDGLGAAKSTCLPLSAASHKGAPRSFSTPEDTAGYTHAGLLGDAGHKKEMCGDVLSMSKYNFIENYVIDFASSSNFTDSNSRFSTDDSSPFTDGDSRPSCGADEKGPGHAGVLSFVYGQKAYVPRKRKCVLLPSKRYKFFIVIDIAPVVHRLPDYTSNLIVTSTYFSDCEIGVSGCRQPARQRSLSNTEERSFVGRDFDYDMITLYQKKRTRRKDGERAPHRGRCQVVK